MNVITIPWVPINGISGTRPEEAMRGKGRIRNANVNIYIELTKRFNQGRLRAVLAGGQAVVLHRLAIMSKDGDWILREDEEALTHVLGVLESYGARDLISLAQEVPERVAALATQRPVLRAIRQGLSALEAALDAERRQLIHANERRLARYMKAAERWAEAWPAVAEEIEGKPLPLAHRIVCHHAEDLLPFSLKEESS